MDTPVTERSQIPEEPILDPLAKRFKESSYNPDAFQYHPLRQEERLQ
jgi:hypothetical protein